MKVIYINWIVCGSKCVKVSFCHCLVTQQLCVSASACWILKQMSEYIFFFFFLLPSRSCLSVFFFFSFPSRSSGVRREGSRSWDESRGHRGKASVRLLTGKRKMEQKNYEVPEFKKKNEQKNKKRKRSGAKIFALSPPYVWHFICLYVFFFSWSDWKGLGKNENIFVKRWLTTGICVCYHISPCV